VSRGSALDDSLGSTFGRDGDLSLIHAFIDRAAGSGGALLLTGEAGVGKTVLLAEAARYADAAGVRVLRAVGAQFEVAVSFAGLHRVVYPLLGEIPALSVTFRKALDVVLGVSEGPPPGQLLVSNALTALLERASAERPLLMIIDDVPWLDRASASVLGILARRLEGSQVGLLAAARTDDAGFFDRDGLPSHEVGPLDDASSLSLVMNHFPALVPSVRSRLLSVAQGNPLALLELPLALSPSQRAGTGPLPAVLPLSRRLQAVFESRIQQLPASTRHILLVAVLEGTGSLGALLAAEPRGLEDLADAERARLVQVDEATDRLVFRHPLTRSAVVDLSTVEERRRVHEVLAEYLLQQPERRAWHLASAAAGPDEKVAVLLEEAAHEARRRGDAVAAIAALLRAADLSPLGPQRSRRLAEAAYLGAVMNGDLSDVPRLLDSARQAGEGLSGSLVAAVAAAHHLLLSGDGDIDTAHRLLVGAIEMQPEPYRETDDTLVEALYTLGWVCYFGGRAQLWEPFHAASDRLTPGVPKVLSLLRNTFADPARTALPALAQLDEAIAGLPQVSDPVWVARVALASIFVDRLPGCRTALWRILREGREGKAITLSLHALSLLGLDHAMTGEWDEAQALADEHVDLCQKHGYRLLECLGMYVHAIVAAGRGDDDRVRTLTDRMSRWASARQVVLVLRLVAQVRTLAALGSGNFEDAYRHASVVSCPGELPSHVPHALWLVMELTEAAVRSGRPAEAAAHVAAARSAGLAAISPRYALIVEGAAAMAASEQDAPALFEKALAVPGADRWPFDLARVHLAYGERLRRMRVTTAARPHLAAAHETFERLGARPWAARAAAELRASGLGQRSDQEPAPLTPQQREIASLAAAGLTNKQIGQRLFLSPRTVATHLYQIFPKLGITSRAALRDALAGRPDEQSGRPDHP
jgi:DNA-binding CsgD family transcriptional regulator